MASRRNIPSLETEGRDAMKILGTMKTATPKEAITKRVPGGQTHEEETVQNENLDGHTADRTNMLPWDSCGPDCPVCAEFEK